MNEKLAEVRKSMVGAACAAVAAFLTTALNLTEADMSNLEQALYPVLSAILGGALVWLVPNRDRQGEQNS